MQDTWLTAIALVLIFEGIFPLISPARWRQVFSQLIQLDEGQIRFFGLIAVVIGLFLLTWLQ
ncbi:MAG: DUF2065 domain-containing protein [Betaproteobacteria bacterium]|nr:DUF2065 domain-containing protein [Burkholderiales bacterium]NBX14846.1 DUF2065 domain-containing protein [Betaproteobacteria bacterium]NBX90256.1 DUF2065 domain-containing protein [Betaproteobacteria bacterium]